MKKNCVICDTVFEAKGKTSSWRVTCGGECTKERKRLVRKPKPKQHKQCKQCGVSFIAPRKDKQYCSDACGIKFRTLRLGERNKKKRAEKRKTRKCLVCSSSITDKYRRKYCSIACVKEVINENVCARARKEVRERQKKNPKYCKSCNNLLVTTARNYHSKERCEPCQEVREKRKVKKWREENDMRMRDYFKTRHAHLMTNDPAYREKRRERNRKKREDPMHKLRERLSKGIRRGLQGYISSVFDVLDFTVDDIASRFETLFVEGMSWDNMSEWHIDHIRPVSSFNFTTTDCEDFKKCWALDNLQPLWAIDNLRKSNKWDNEMDA